MSAGNEFMHEEMCVYKLTHKPTGMAYIGKSKNKLRDRLRNHHIFEKFDGADDFIVEIVFNALNHKSLLEVEAELIREYDTTSPNGLNTILPSVGQAEEVTLEGIEYSTEGVLSEMSKKKKGKTIRLSDDVWGELEKLAENRGFSLNNYILVVLMEHLCKKNNQNE